MIKARGIIRPGGGYKQHFHGDIHFHGDRRFIVDTEAKRDEHDDPHPKREIGPDGRIKRVPKAMIVLTPATYEELREKFNSGTLVCEPETEGSDEREEVSALKQRLAEAAGEIERHGQVIAELREQERVEVQRMRAQFDLAHGEVVIERNTLRARVAELEAAAKKAKKDKPE
jgi:hypothetical protein